MVAVNAAKNMTIIPNNNPKLYVAKATLDDIIADVIASTPYDSGKLFEWFENVIAFKLDDSVMPVTLTGILTTKNYAYLDLDANCLITESGDRIVLKDFTDGLKKAGFKKDDLFRLRKKRKPKVIDEEN